MKTIIEKKHRLNEEFYKGEKTVSFVACIKNRSKVFTNENIFEEFKRILLIEVKTFGCLALIYLFMPDHAHIILKGKDKNSNVIKCIDMFKQKTGFWFYQNNSSVKWQKDYYDHIIRNDEDLKDHIYYILNNPVRSGIVNNWKDYKFKGSDVYNFDEWS